MSTLRFCSESFIMCNGSLQSCIYFLLFLISFEDLLLKERCNSVQLKFENIWFKDRTNCMIKISFSGILPYKIMRKNAKWLWQKLGWIHFQVKTQQNFSKLLAMKKILKTLVRFPTRSEFQVLKVNFLF